MVKLTFEVWRSPLSVECTPIAEQADRARDPKAVLTHVLEGETFEEVMQQYHRLNGWGPYNPVPGRTDQPFTQAHLDGQNAYMARRPAQFVQTPTG